MNRTDSTDLAGAIRVTLLTRDGRVEAAELASTRRTDFSRRLFRGHDVAQLLDTLPLVFSVCATAQSSAAVQAVEDAARTCLAQAHADARGLLVLAETAREHLFRILLGWTAWLGAPPPAGRLTALGRMRSAWAAALYPQADAFRPGGGTLRPDAAPLTTLVEELDGLLTLALGIGRAEWAAIADEGALGRWAAGGDAVAQRMLADVLGRGIGELGRSDIGPLPDIAADAIAPRLVGDAADAFVAAPEWDGVPRETGAVQRQAASPLVAALLLEHGNSVLTRQVARLVELVATVNRIERQLDTLVPADPGSVPAAISGSGIAQVEAARGRLVHRVDLRDGRVADYRILAPTEWNFHAHGALAQGLLTLPAADGLARLAQLLVDAVDPCVESRIEVTETPAGA